jgi:hypothetical protein
MVRAGGAFPLSRFLTAVPARAPNYVTITYGSDVTGFDAVRVGRGMPRAPVPFCGCGGTPHGRGSFAERTVSGGRLSGRGKRVAKQAGVATKRAFIYNMYKKGCWYLVASEPFGDGVRDLREYSRRVSKGSAASTYCRSGRTWTLLALPVRGERERGGRKARWPGFPHSGKERAGTEGESGKAGVPSQWEGTSQDKGRKRDGLGSLAMGSNGPGRKRRKRDGLGSLAVGRNGPGRKEESGMAGVPSQWEGTGQEKKERAGWPGFPRNGKERARKKRRKRDGRSPLAMGRNGPGGERAG